MEPQLYRHKKTGGIYELMDEALLERTMEPSVLYRNLDTGQKWIRPASEFHDGRFERIFPFRSSGAHVETQTHSSSS